jgi:hypothetical protein
MVSLVSLYTSLSLTTERTVISLFPFIVLHNPNYNDKLISKPYVSGSKITAKHGLSSAAEFEIWKGLQRPPNSAVHPLKTHPNSANKLAQLCPLVTSTYRGGVAQNSPTSSSGRA